MSEINYEQKKYESIDIENLRKYSTFETTSEMDAKIYEYIEILRADDQPESVIEVLRFFGRSSLRIKGVSFAKYQTIADNIGMSKRTVIRAINTLSTYGMIERIPTVKKWNGRSLKKSVNIIVIQPSITTTAPQQDTSVIATETSENKQSRVENESEPIFYNHNKKHIKDTEQAPVSALRNAIPKVIYDTMAPFFDANALYRIYGVLIRAKASIDRTITVENHPNEFADVFLNAIGKMKKGLVRNLDGYLYTSWQEVCRVIKRKETFTEGKNVLAYDWLTN